MAWLRRAGRADLPEDRVLLWSVAEGRRGHRWRASTRDARHALLDDLLLEVDPGGRIIRVELTTSAGQLTFHPEPDERTAHGNVVTAHGIRHLALPWSPGRRIELPWSPVADAVMVAGLGGHGQRELPVATIGRDLEPGLRTVTVEAVDPGRWRVDGRPVAIDADGLPLLAGGSAWPLEDPAVRPG